MRVPPPPEWLAEYRDQVEARVAQGTAGQGLPTPALLSFRRDHAAARDAVHSTLDEATLRGALPGAAPFVATSAAPDRATYLTRPDLGRRLSEDSRALLRNAPRAEVALVLADGLSASAVMQEAAPLVNALLPDLPEAAQVVLAHQARVALGDEIAMALGATWAIVLIGERPGLSSAQSMGAYLTMHPQTETQNANRFCISNIRSGGLTTAQASARIGTLMARAKAAGFTGVEPATLRNTSG